MMAKLEIGGLSSKGLLSLTGLVANEFDQQTVLLKDFNENKFYLVRGTE